MKHIFLTFLLVAIAGCSQKEKKIIQDGKMNEEKFWAIIKKAEGLLHLEHVEEIIGIELDNLSREEVEKFYQLEAQFYFEAYTWDLWAVAYMNLAGCSDDGFMDYRGWLVYQGQDIYTLGIIDPDSLDTYLLKWEKAGEEPGYEGYTYICGSYYEKRFGKEPPDLDISHPEEPKGENWDEDEFATKFPKMAKAFEWEE